MVRSAVAVLSEVSGKSHPGALPATEREVFDAVLVNGPFSESLPNSTEPPFKSRRLSPVPLIVAAGVACILGLALMFLAAMRPGADAGAWGRLTPGVLLVIAGGVGGGAYLIQMRRRGVGGIVLGLGLLATVLPGMIVLASLLWTRVGSGLDI